MSSKKYAAPLRLDLRPSLLLSLLVAAMHIVALASVWLLSLPSWLSVLASILLVYSAWHNIAHHALRRRANSIVALLWDEHDQWHLLTRAGERLQAMLSADSFVHPKLVVLNYKLPGRWRGRSVVIPADAMALQPLRQLRVRLKLTSCKSLA